jgi:membrane associated rhomboid family serine protease
MLPLRDNNPTRWFPIVTILLIALNVLVFLYELSLQQAGGEDALNGFFCQSGLIPVQVTHLLGLASSRAVEGNSICGGLENVGPPVTLDLLTSMFLHGGWLHIGGNMLYLWIFGNNIEDAMGRLRFIIFYLLGGLAASLTQVLITPSSGVPNIGASGAIAAVLGAYIVLYPRAQVQTLIFLGYFIRFDSIPAIIVLGYWFVLQLFSGLTSLGADATSGGVAVFAHIGGFVFGAVLARVFTLGRGGGADWRWQQRY